MTEHTGSALPPVVDQKTWQAALEELRAREKAATRELDAIAAQRRRLPMVELPDYTLIGPDGPVRLVDVFDGRSQLIVYNHMWTDGEQWQCGGCTGFTSQYVRLGFLDNYDARFVVVTSGPIEEALAYKATVGNMMDWYSSSDSSFGADVGAPPGGGFAVNVFLRDGDTVYRTWHTDGRGTEQLSHTFPLIDLLPWGRQEDWQDSPEGWPSSPTYSKWLDSPDIARLYGRDAPAVKPSRSGHLPINELSLYHEVYGDLDASPAPPLLLVPGAFMSTDSMAAWVSAFAATRPVIVFDQQGHGRTPDTPRPMSFEQFADDAAELLRALGVERAAVLGYSQGGGVALQLALRHPTLVDKLVSLSATYHKDGLYPSVVEGIQDTSGTAFAGSPIEKAFLEHTPDSAAFDAFVAKVSAMNAKDQAITDAQLRSISAKTMVIVGDADCVRPEHALAMFMLRGGGDEQAAGSGMLQSAPPARLAVLPAMSHLGISAQQAVLVPMINAFLDDLAPATPSLF